MLVSLTIKKENMPKWTDISCYTYEIDTLHIIYILLLGKSKEALVPLFTSLVAMMWMLVKSHLNSEIILKIPSISLP